MPNKLSPHGKTIVEGSVSWGTLRTQDLLRAFAQELEEVKPFGERDLINEALSCANDIDTHKPCEDIAQEVLAGLMEALDSAAPDGMYFGTIEGDWSDFGFWSLPGFWSTEEQDDD